MSNDLLDEYNSKLLGISQVLNNRLYEKGWINFLNCSEKELIKKYSSAIKELALQEGEFNFLNVDFGIETCSISKYISDDKIDAIFFLAQVALNFAFIEELFPNRRAHDLIETTNLFLFLVYSDFLMDIFLSD